MLLSLVRRPLSGAVAVHLVLRATCGLERKQLEKAASPHRRTGAVVADADWQRWKWLKASGQDGAAADLPRPGWVLYADDRGLELLPRADSSAGNDYQWIGVVPESDLSHQLLCELEALTDPDAEVGEVLRLLDHLVLEMQWHLTELPVIPADLFGCNVGRRQTDAPAQCSALVPSGSAD